MRFGEGLKYTNRWQQGCDNKLHPTYCFHVVPLQRRACLPWRSVMRGSIDVVWRVQTGICRVPQSTITLPKQTFSSWPTQRPTTSPMRFVRAIDSRRQLWRTLTRRRPRHRGSQSLMLMRMRWGVVKMHRWWSYGGFVMMRWRWEAIFTVALWPSFVAQWQC